MSVKQYRKKPVVVEAMELYPANADEVVDWVNGDWPEIAARASSRGVWGIDIFTLEGTMRADMGDFVIRGVQGEFYPCKPDIFEQTYEEVA